MTGNTCKSNRMCLIHFLLFTIVRAVETHTLLSENIYNNNGWIPINRDKVYNNLPETLFPGTNIKETLKQNTNEIAHNQREYADMEATNFFTQPSYINFQENVAFSQNSENIFTDTKVEKVEENMVKLNTTKSRKGKNMVNDGIDVVNILTKPEITTQTNSNQKNGIVTDINKSLYHVTENQEDKEDLEEIYSDEIKPLIDEPSNNHYDIVNRTVEDGINSNSNEFINKFLGILSSYNIRVNDLLPNYELSRHLNRNIPTREYIMVPIPIRFVNRLNSVNRIPYDPLLAVFLSNFGFYLPGHYGINNKYYNLYGYLASNNIHNNEPFGSYKIFADTDSSN